MRKKVLIIAEAGVNHNGQLAIAKSLIRSAAQAGADIVKFQTFKTENLVNRSAEKAAYQLTNTGELSGSQYSMLKKLEIPEHWYEEMLAYCKELGIQFLSTAFDNNSLDFLDKFNLPIIKVPSGEITNKPYLRHVASKGRPVVLSTGMTNLQEVKEALNVLTHEGLHKANITVLHCNTEYPTPMEDVNLLAMVSMATDLDVRVGYSDHTLGIEVPIAAVALGAEVIEKHLTLDRKMPGPDHAASLEPVEFSAMVNAIRNLEKAIGDGVKRVSHSEMKNMTVARKSLVAACSIRKGEILTPSNVTVKRPGTGLSPMLWDELIGTRAIRDFLEDELIEW